LATTDLGIPLTGGTSAGFANGVLTYHLNILEQLEYVNKFRHNNITRYYPLSIPSSDLKII
jgi:predicted transcriptional regulator